MLCETKNINPEPEFQEQSESVWEVILLSHHISFSAMKRISPASYICILLIG